MVYCRLESSFRNHPKVRKLAKALGVRRPEARGYLSALWSWAVDYAPDGDLSSFDAEDIEFGVDWDGSQGVLVEALEQVGLLDRTAFGWEIHDWMERAESFRNATRMRERRSKKRSEQDQHATSTRSEQGRGPTSREEREERRGEEREEKRYRTSDEVLTPSAPKDEKPETLELVPATPRLEPEAVLAAWQRTCVPAGLPSVRKLSKKRRALIEARTAEIPKGENPRTWWEHYFARIADAPFCTGGGDRGWKADIDWACKSEDIVNRVFEGRYDQSYEKKHPIDREIEELLSNDRAPTVHDMPRPPTLGSGGGFDRLDDLPGGSNEN